MANLIKTKLNEVKKSVIEQIDQDENGKIEITDIIALAVKIPGIHVNREDFLRKEFFKNHSADVIDQAIATTPANAGIASDEIEKIANEVIKFERNCVSGISTALGLPGGIAMGATIPADIAQYYAYTLRAAQKLLYLYGFPEINSTEDGIQLDTETMNTMVMCLGVMYGVAGANNAIKAMAKALAVGVEKQLMNKALTKGTFFPLVKSVMKWFGVKLTKSVFTGFFKKAIPIVGGIIGGGITYVSFKPCCERLKDALKDTMLSNPKHVSNDIENAVYNSIVTGEAVDTYFADDNDESPNT